jgi:hypothetical protein
MTLDEKSLLETLDGIVRSEKMRAQIRPIVERVRADLSRKTKAVMAWEPIPLEIFGGALPSGIRSAWVFILRAGANTGAERHPNSHQRMMSFEGSGDLQVRAELAVGRDDQWQSNVLVSELDAPLEQRWVSIPSNVWHQPVIPKSADWVVVSFHTVPAEELIEERLAENSDAADGTKQMVYLSKKEEG